MIEQDAIDFFSELFYGKHHIPKRKGQKSIEQYGEGYCINTHNLFSTFDNNELTRLVILAHKHFMRVEISPASPNYLKIIIFKRDLNNKFAAHPSLDDLINNIQKVRGD